MWVARSKSGVLELFSRCPKRINNEFWEEDDIKLGYVDNWLAPAPLEWEDEPIEVYLVPKKNFDQFMEDGKQNLRRVEENMRVLSNWAF